jgi:hypothetical protein
LSYRDQDSTGVGQASESFKTTKAERKLKEWNKVVPKANLSLIESVNRLDCGGWEKETTCGIRPASSPSQPCVTSFDDARDLASAVSQSLTCTLYLDLEEHNEHN